MKIDSTWVIISLTGLVLVLYLLGFQSDVFLINSLISVIIIAIVLEIVVPILSGDKGVIYLASYLVLGLFFYVALGIFKKELDSIIDIYLDISGYKWRESLYWLASVSLALAGIRIEEYLVEEMGISRKAIILGIGVFGALIIGFYEFAGEDNLEGTIYGKLASRIKKAPRTFLGLLVVLAGIYIKINKGSKSK